MKHPVSNDLKKAESLKEIKTLPEVQEKLEIEKEQEAISDNPEDFRMAIGRAQMDGLEYIEVTERLFKYLVKNQPTRYLTYGNPGVKVYVQGTREEIERVEKLSAEDYANYLAKNRKSV